MRGGSPPTHVRPPPRTPPYAARVHGGDGCDDGGSVCGANVVVVAAAAAGIAPPPPPTPTLEVAATPAGRGEGVRASKLRGEVLKWRGEAGSTRGEAGGTKREAGGARGARLETTRPMQRASQRRARLELAADAWLVSCGTRQAAPEAPTRSNRELLGGGDLVGRACDARAWVGGRMSERAGGLVGSHGAGRCRAGTPHHGEVSDSLSRARRGEALKDVQAEHRPCPILGAVVSTCAACHANRA